MLVADLKAYLVGKGITSPIALMSQPEAPDEVVTLIDTGGYQPDFGTSLREPTVQVLARAGPGDYPEAKALAEQVFGILHGKSGFQIGAAFVYLCEALQDVTPIGTDGSGRWEMTCNYHFKTRSVS